MTDSTVHAKSEYIADAPAELALAFSNDSVTLMCRPSGQEWHELGEAIVSSPEFATEIDALRVEALVRDPSRAPVTIWLPAEQVLERDYVLGNSVGSNARREALSRLESETPYSVSELAVAIAPALKGEPVRVLAALQQTVGEARAHAESWGFVSGTISARGYEPSFGRVGPVFGEAGSVRAGKRWLAAAAAVALVAVGSLALWQMPVSLPSASKVTEIAPTPVDDTYSVSDLRVISPDTGMHRADDPLSAPARSGVQALAWPRPLLDAQTPSGIPNASAPVDAEAYSPPSIVARQDDPRLLLGHAPRVAARHKPARLTAPSTAGDNSGVDPIAVAETAPRSKPRPAAQRPKRQAPEAAATPVTQPENPSGSATESTAAGTTPEVEARSRYAVAKSPLPPAKPQREASNQAAATVVSVVETTPEPAPRQAEVATAPPAEKPKPKAPLTSAGSLVPIAPTEASDAPSVYAVSSAPIPKPRPQPPVADSPVRLTPSPIRLSRNVPRRVGHAALEHGLTLDQTSLIGIIDARSGRQALVRLPDGNFRKLSRGDRLEGWRVSSISNEAMRLTRNGQRRVLLLVVQ